MTAAEKDALVELAQRWHGTIVRRTGDGKNWWCHSCGALDVELGKLKHESYCPLGIALAERKPPINGNGW